MNPIQSHVYSPELLRRMIPAEFAALAQLLAQHEELHDPLIDFVRTWLIEFREAFHQNGDAQAVKDEWIAKLQPQISACLDLNSPFAAPLLLWLGECQVPAVDEQGRLDLLERFQAETAVRQANLHREQLRIERLERMRARAELLQEQTELEPLQQLIDRSALFRQDDLYTGLTRWLADFRAQIREPGDLPRVKAAFIPLLQELLVDSFFQKPLGEQPLLGSDGFTYSAHTLSVYLLLHDLDGRSPLTHEPNFSVSIDPLAQAAIAYLEKNGAMLHDVALEAQYQTLIDRGYPMELPTREAIERREEAERHQRIAEAQRARGERTIRRLEQLEQAVDAIETQGQQAINERFAPVFTAIEANHAHGAALMDRMEQIQADVQTDLDRELNELAQARITMEDEAKRLLKLRDEIIDVDTTLARVEQKNLELEIAANQFRDEIICRRKERERQLGLAIGIACLAIGAAIVLPPLLTVVAEALPECTSFALELIEGGFRLSGGFTF